jgi:hypothetical protein
MTTTPTKCEEVGVYETARRLSIMPDHAYDLIQAERLRARKVAGRWKVDVASINERLAALENRAASNSK